MQNIYLIAGAIIVIGLIYVYLILKGKTQQTNPDYRMFFYMGLIFLPIGISNPPFLILSLVFIAIGLVNKSKWKPEQKWSEIPPAQRNLKIGVMVVLGLLIIGGFVMWYLGSQQPKGEIAPQSLISEDEARSIAENSCIKGGDALSSGGMYNENSKTWWFDANLNATQEGCNPACVVSEETKTAEINWRCTGVIPPKTESTAIKCLSEQRNVDACIEIYQPVCATVQIQCFTTPCNPIQKTFSNSCFACQNSLVSSYIEGECPSS